MKQQSPINPKAERLLIHLDALARRTILQGKVALEDDVSLTRQEFRLVLVLGEKPSFAMGELAERMMFAVNSLTPLVDRLVAKRLVRREHAEDDRRVVLAVLTAQGRRLSDQCRRNRLGMARAMLMALDEREQDVFLKLVTKIGSAGAVTRSLSKTVRAPNTHERGPS